MKATKTVKKMSKRDIIRGMYFRAELGITGPDMNLTYLARRLRVTSKKEALWFARACQRLGFCKFIEKTPSLIVFIL